MNVQGAQLHLPRVFGHRAPGYPQRDVRTRRPEPEVWSTEPSSAGPTSRSRVAWLSAETPDRSGAGGQRRQFHQILALLERDIDVRVATLAGPQDDGTLRGLVPVVRFGPLRGRGLLSDPTLERFLADGDFSSAVVAHLESVPHVRRALVRHDIPWLIDLHNVNSRWHGARDDRLRHVVWRVRERAALRRATVATTCSREERDAVLAIAPGARVEVAGHGIDPHEWPDDALAQDRLPAAVFFGAWGHGPNRQGVEWLVKHVWPQVLDAVPEARLMLAGPGEPPAAVAGRPGVEYVGRVDDLARLLGRVRVAVVPIIDGIGARVKFGEALASGVAVVSTSAGAEGFEAEGTFSLADEANAFASACIELVGDRDRAERLGRRGRAFAFERCLWSRTSEPLIRFVRSGRGRP
jgi:glycosyltransferase involved in cell wall biosynthesis